MDFKFSKVLISLHIGTCFTLMYLAIYHHQLFVIRRSLGKFDYRKATYGHLILVLRPVNS